MRKVATAVGITGAILFALLVWPSAYRYENTRISNSYDGGSKVRLVRIHRITGHAQYLDNLGWLNLQP